MAISAMTTNSSMGVNPFDLGMQTSFRYLQPVDFVDLNNRHDSGKSTGDERSRHLGYASAKDRT